MMYTEDNKPIYDTIYCQTKWFGSLGEHLLIFDVLELCWRYVYFVHFTGRQYRCDDYYKAMLVFGKLNDNIVGFMRGMLVEYDAGHEPPVRNLRESMRKMWPRIEATYSLLYGFDLDGRWTTQYLQPPKRGPPIPAPSPPDQPLYNTHPTFKVLPLTPGGKKGKARRASRSTANGTPNIG